MLRRLTFWALLTIAPAFADLTEFQLDSSIFTTPPGGIANSGCQNFSTLQCVIFTGEIAFTIDQDYFLQDLFITMGAGNPDGGTDVVGNDNYFQVNVPGTFGPDGVTSGAYSGGLFEIDVDPSTPLGVYTGTVQLQALDSSENPIYSTLDFTVNVVPEPALFAPTLAGLILLAAMVRHRMRSPRQG